MERLPIYQNHLDTPVKLGTDVAGFTVLIGAFMNVLPNITALLTLVWLLIRIWETDTIRNLTGRNKKE